MHSRPTGTRASPAPARNLRQSRSQPEPQHRKRLLVWVDGRARLLAVEELLDHGLWDTRGSTHQDHLVDIVLVDATVAQVLLHRTHRVVEVVLVQLFEPSSRQGARILGALEQRINLEGGLRG